MRRIVRRWTRVGAAAGLLLGLALAVQPRARAELCDVTLTSGVTLRGDVRREDDALILRNELGELRIPLARVARVEPVRAAEAPPDEPATQPATRPTATRPAATRPTATRPTDEGLPGGAPEDAQAVPADAGPLDPMPRLSDLDITRLKMGELTRAGPPEKLRVRFRRDKPGGPELPELVLAELRERDDFDPAWERILTRGRAEERLQLIVRETGTKYAHLVDISGDPEAFEMFTRRVLPLVDRTCARSGCHAGTNARRFRFPIGSSRSEEYVYTSYVLLEQLQTRYGPLIDRAVPNQSVLLDYLLPQEDNPRAHKDVGKGPSFRAALRSSADPEYRAVLDWIDFLLSPRPEYNLNYENPYRGPFGPDE